MRGPNELITSLIEQKTTGNVLLIFSRLKDATDYREKLEEINKSQRNEIRRMKNEQRDTSSKLTQFAIQFCDCDMSEVTDLL